MADDGPKSDAADEEPPDAAEHGSALSLFGDREFLALSSTAFARSQAYSTLLIALALYADLFGTTGTVEGLFGTAFAAVQFLIVVPIGRAVDVGDAKRWLIGGLFVNVAVFVAFVFVSDPTHVILVRVLQGVGASILWLTGSSVVGEIAPEAARGRWLGSYNQVTAFSSLAGDLAGGYLLTVYGFTDTYTVMSALTLLATVMVFFYLRDNPGGNTAESTRPYVAFIVLSANAVGSVVVAYIAFLRFGVGTAFWAVAGYVLLSAAALVAVPWWLFRRGGTEEDAGLDALFALLKRPMIQNLVVFRMSFAVGKMAVIIFLPIYARTTFGISAVEIGGILAGGKLTKTLLQGKMGDWTDAFGHEHLFVAGGALCYAVGTALIPLAEYAVGVVPAVTVPGVRTFSAAYVTLFGAYAVIGVADSIRLPASMSLFVREGEVHDSVASSFSLRSISWKLGQVVGPVGVGFVMDAVSTLAAFWTAAGFVVVATGLFLVLHRWNVGPATATA